MPPRKPSGSLFSEEGLARRIAIEREQRGWTYEGLAKRMQDAGCPVNQSAIYKIEKGTKGRDGTPGPLRRITVDELVAFSTVFDVPIEELLLPPDLADARRAVALWQQMQALTRQLAPLEEALEAAQVEFREVLAESRPVVVDALMAALDDVERQGLQSWLRWEETQTQPASQSKSKRGKANSNG